MPNVCQCLGRVLGSCAWACSNHFILFSPSCLCHIQYLSEEAFLLRVELLQPFLPSYCPCHSQRLSEESLLLRAQLLQHFHAVFIGLASDQRYSHAGQVSGKHCSKLFSCTPSRQWTCWAQWQWPLWVYRTTTECKNSLRYGQSGSVAQLQSARPHSGDKFSLALWHLRI